MLISGRTYYFSPIGIMEIWTTERGICSIRFADLCELAYNPYHKHLTCCIGQLQDFFNGHRVNMDFPLDLSFNDLKLWVEFGLRFEAEQIIQDCDLFAKIVHENSFVINKKEEDYNLLIMFPYAEQWNEVYEEQCA